MDRELAWISLSLSSSLSRAPFGEREKITRKKSDTKKVRGSGKESTREYDFILLFRKRKRDTFSAQTTTTRTYPLERMCLCTSSVAPCVKSTYEPCFFIFSHLTGVKIWREKFLTFCCVFGCLASEGLGGKGSFFNYTVPRKSDYKKKGVTDTRIITSIVTRRRRKTRKKTKRGRKKTWVLPPPSTLSFKARPRCSPTGRKRRRRRMSSLFLRIKRRKRRI